jgi:DNA-binding NarL/FixJ family response regulator
MDIKVAIFEDNIKFLDAISIMMDGLPGLELLGAFPDTDNIIGRLKASTPDIVLMDIEIAPLNGIDATRLILKHFPSVKILIQTVFDEDSKVFAAICAGASGYIVKRYLPHSLVSSVTELYQGGTPMSPGIANKILTLFRDYFPKAGLHENYNLNKREKEILKYLVDGLSYKMIAAKCFLSFETIKTYIKRIYEKLHVASMTEAVAKAIYENLI